ncbi:MAG: metal ABC transporter substrate-binding protein [Beutenbergiaceae bacterium]
MIKKMPSVLIATTALVALAGCAADSEPESATPAGFTIAVTSYPMEFIASEVAADMAQVQNVTPAGAEPHDLELSPADIATLSQADVILVLSNFQPAVDEALTHIEGPVVLDAADAANLLTTEEQGAHDHDAEHDIESSDEHDHEAEDAPDEAEDAPDEAIDAPEHEAEADLESGENHNGHDHGGLDPHFWLDPLRVADVADALADTLAQADLVNTDGFHSNAASLRTALTELDQQYHDSLTNCASTTLITSHEAFGYLATSYGLDQIGIAGLDPEAETSPARVAQILEEARDAGASTIFTEPGDLTAGTDVIADELGITLAILNPIGRTPSDSDYFGVMTTNLGALTEGLQCR